MNKLKDVDMEFWFVRIVGAAIFLSSDDSDFINGSEIKIDGGWLSSKTRRGEIGNE